MDAQYVSAALRYEGDLHGLLVVAAHADVILDVFHGLPAVSVRDEDAAARAVCAPSLPSPPLP